MKKTITYLSLALCLIASPILPAKEIYRDQSTGKEYLYLGSIAINYELNEGVERKKLLDLKNGAIVWIDQRRLQQSDQLTPREFLNKLFDHGLVFEASGVTPHWFATISEKGLKISKPDGTTQAFAIKIDIEDDPMDGRFVFMFQSEDKQSYGMIHRVSGESCIINNDGDSFFEVFINSQGDIRYGCASLEKV